MFRNFLACFLSPWNVCGGIPDTRTSAAGAIGAWGMWGPASPPPSIPLPGRPPPPPIGSPPPPLGGLVPLPPVHLSVAAMAALMRCSGVRAVVPPPVPLVPGLPPIEADVAGVVVVVVVVAMVAVAIVYDGGCSCSGAIGLSCSLVSVLFSSYEAVRLVLVPDGVPKTRDVPDIGELWICWLTLDCSSFSESECSVPG